MQQDSTLHVFDMDDTLVKTPKLEDIFYTKNGKIKSGDQAIDGAINTMLELSNDAINKEREEKDRMRRLAGLNNKAHFVQHEDAIYFYINDEPAGLDFVEFINKTNSLTQKEKDTILSKLDEKDGKLILGLFAEFFRTEGTVGIETNKSVVETYEKVKNKMILTGRSDAITKGVSYILFNIVGLSEPNFGLYLYKNTSGGVPQYKANVIKNSIREFNWKAVHFYEDRKDWLDFAESQVLSEFPEVKFYKHQIF